MKGDEEGVVAHGLEDLSLSLGVLGSLFLLDYGGFLQHLHRVQFAFVGAASFAHQEHFTIRWNRYPLSPQSPYSIY